MNSRKYWFLSFRRKKIPKKFDNVDEIQSAGSLQFHLSTIKTATNYFSDANKLGEGGFGPVYKGVLPGGEEIAVKRLSRSSGQGEEEFKNEVILLAKLQHRNLVRLLGFCLDGEEKLLIYEYLPNGSLDKLLFDPVRCTTLVWERRYKIIGEIARGLLYLHEDSRHTIIHRDLKTSNILLGADMNPKISDFTRARLFAVGQTEGNTFRVVGTYGYMAPEYAMHGQFSVKSDVFSYGVLVFEIIIGQKINSFYDSERAEDLISYAWRYWKEGKAFELLNPSLREHCSRSEVMKCIHIGLLCVQEDVADRPTMASIVLMLNSYPVTLPLPSPPAFCMQSRNDPKLLSEDSETVSIKSDQSTPWTIDGVDIITSKSLQFDLGTIRNATNNFSAVNKLGEGRLGAVYKGELPDGRQIAVRTLSRITYPRHEIKNELDLLLTIQHRNLVWLLGFCLEDKKGNQAIIFIYEYVSNGSLDKYIFDNTKKSYLDWDKRYKIIVSIARGLLYAHEDSRFIMIHGDLKATNILLDDEMNPMVADFGISRLFDIYQTQGNSTRIGTISGYMPPEYLLEGFMSAKADVYSFGVLLLEIISGKRITSFHRSTPSHNNLLGYAWNHLREGTSIELMDPSLNDSFLRDEVLRSIHIGLLCVQNKVEDRPIMREVVVMLNNKSDIAGFPFPSQPAFYGERITHSNMTKQETELVQCNTSSDGYDIRANESLQFDLATIRNATNNFSASNKIGGGGFGNVYKGVLSGQEIAVKRVSRLEDFKNEVMLMHRLRLQHRNLVRVLGFYLEGEEKILIHEYVPNSSLDSYLFDNIKRSDLDWEKRYKIIGDIARGLLYLHEGSRFKIIHRNLKSQNILLDGAMNAKIADFGLAKLFVHHQTQGRTSKVAGTLGYMAPEYIRDGLISVKSDVFSFGILLLEIVSGQRANSFHHPDPEYTHLEYLQVWTHWKKGSTLDRLVDPALHDDFWKDEVMRCIHIGLLCVQENVEDRPTMSLVVGMLNDHSLTLEAPSQLAFCAENISNITTSETELEDSPAQSCNSSPFNPRG